MELPGNTGLATPRRFKAAVEVEFRKLVRACPCVGAYRGVEAVFGAVGVLLPAQK